jgi:hypothetical protein
MPCWRIASIWPAVGFVLLIVLIFAAFPALIILFKVALVVVLAVTTLGVSLYWFH